VNGGRLNDDSDAGMRAVVNCALGLPLGDKTSHGKRRNKTDSGGPRGIISPDREPNRPAARERER
jgi:hypothetical protein